MNNTLKMMSIALVTVLAVAAFGAGIAFAQSPNPNPNTGFGPGSMMGGSGQSGYGMMDGLGQTGGNTNWMSAMHQWMTTTGGMHIQVLDTVASKLGMTSAELTAAVNSGQTLSQLAAAKGVSRTDLVSALETAHKDSLSQAVTSGVLTQAQADSMLAQMAGRYEWMLDNANLGGMMNSSGAGFSRRGMMGGAGSNWNGSATPQPRP